MGHCRITVLDMLKEQQQFVVLSFRSLKSIINGYFYDSIMVIASSKSVWNPSWQNQCNPKICLLGLGTLMNPELLRFSLNLNKKMEGELSGVVPPRPKKKKKGRNQPTKPHLHGLSKKRSAIASSAQHDPHKSVWRSLTIAAWWERPIKTHDYLRSSETDGGPTLLSLPHYQPLPHGWGSTAHVFDSCLNYTEPPKFEL